MFLQGFIMNNETNICMGCLSAERKLLVLNEECKQSFCGLLDTSNHSQQMSLCYECLALLQRGIQFKKQVKHAYSFLCSYLIHNKIPILSKLNLSKTVCFDNLSDSQTEDSKKEQEHKESESKGKSDTYIRSSDCNLIKCEGIFDQKSKKNITEPLAFVKVEDGGIDDQEFKQELRKASVFSDSDNEPLTMSSNKSGYKRKREKNKNESPKKTKSGEQASGVVSDPRVAKKLKELNVDSGHIALVMLTWEEVEEERRLALESVQFTRHAHRCSLCGVGYNHAHKLHEHNKKHSEEAGSEVCDICTIRFKTRAALASHTRRHRARWVCQHGACGARYSRAGVAADHCARAHAAPPPAHRCPRCAHSAASLGALRMHIKSHSSRPECALCGKTFRDKNSLRTHTFVHKGEKEHACSVCDKRFMFKKQKEVHEITHMEHQNLYCHQCDVSFKNQTSYYQHMKYNLKHIDPADIKHACQLCDKKFVKAKRLEEHNLAVHLKLAPIKCTVPECTFACPSRAALRSHARLLHRGARALRNHVCHRCGRTYKSKKSLDTHLRSHATAQTTEVDTPA